MDAGAADYGAFVRREDPECPIGRGVEGGRKAIEPLLDDVERRRFFHRPRHPGAQMIQIRVDGAFEQRRILASPAAQHQSARHDPFR